MQKNRVNIKYREEKNYNLRPEVEAFVVDGFEATIIRGIPLVVDINFKPCKVNIFLN